MGDVRHSPVWSTKRQVFVSAFCLLGTVAIALWWTSRAPRLNVVLITLDTTRADHIGSYGYQSAATPCLDRLAVDSVQFDRAYTVAPITLPTHATLLTGLLPPEHGLRINRSSRLPDSIATLAEVLSRQGHRTAAFVSTVVLNRRTGLERGFETYDDRLEGLPGRPPVERPAAETVSAAIAWLNSFTSEPLFCWVHLYDPHAPYEAHADEFGSQFENAPYDAEIAYMDQHVGRLLDTLTRLGIDDRTLLVVAGDHGEGLGDHGEAMHGFLAYNSTMHVPLWIRHPLIKSRDRRVAHPVSLADVFPTILDALDLPLPSGLSGQSLLGNGPPQATEGRPCYGESEAPYMEGGWSPLRTWTTDRWKYIHTTVPELYDLQSDPGETVNLIDRHPNEVARLGQALADFEATLTIGEETAVASTDEELRALSALGYAGGQAPARKSHAPLRDIKETLRHAEQVHHCSHLLEHQDVHAAEKILDEVVAAVPDYAKAWGMLGLCAYLQENYAVAALRYRRALELDANQNSARIGLGRALFMQDQLEEAVEQLQTAVSVDASSLDAQFYLGEACRRLRRWQEAGSAFAAAVKISPKFVRAQIGLADLARDTGELEQAADRYRAVLQLDPLATSAALAGSRVLAQLGREGEAIEMLAESLRRSPPPLELLTDLAYLLATARNPELRDVPQSVVLAEEACRVTNRRAAAPLRTLAVAYAADGRLNQAISAAEAALEIARQSESTSLATAIDAELRSYKERGGDATAE